MVGVNAVQRQIYLDRTGADELNFHPGFRGRYSARLLASDRRIKLHVFMDTSSIEVFADDGALLLTALTFSSGANRGLEFLGAGKGSKIHSIDAWSLKSIWKVE